MQRRRYGNCGLLVSDDPREDKSYPTIARSLGDVNLEHVLGGDEGAVIAYVVAWRTARSRLLEHVASVCPDLKLPPLTVEALAWRPCKRRSVTGCAMTANQTGSPSISL